MATKRPPQKDLDVSPLQLKQPRLEMHVASQPPLFTSKPRNVTTQSGKGSPTLEITSSTRIPTSTQVAISPTAAAKTSFDFHTITSTHRSSRMPHTSQATSVVPPFVIPIGASQQRNVLHPQFVQSRPPPPSEVPPIVGHSPFISMSSSGVVTAPILPTPPPPYFTTSDATPNGSGMIPAQLSGERPSGFENSSELVCSSPSQFLHPPTSVCVSSSAEVCSSASSSELSSILPNRQPFCSSEKIYISGKDKLSVDRMMKVKVLKYRRAKLASLKLKHEVELKEKFFLEH